MNSFRSSLLPEVKHRESTFLLKSVVRIKILINQLRLASDSRGTVRISQELEQAIKELPYDEKNSRALDQVFEAFKYASLYLGEIHDIFYSALY